MAAKKAVKKVTKRKLKRFHLEVSFPFQLNTYSDLTAQVEKLVGKRSSGAGTGFGMRDVSFSGLTKSSVKNAVEVLLNAKIKDLVFSVSPSR